MTIDDVRQIALSYPGVAEHTTFGSPTFKVGKRFLASVAKIDSDALCLKLPDQFEREFLLDSNPGVFYSTPHYADYDSILIRMSKVDPDEMRDLFERAWRSYAPKRLVASYEFAAVNQAGCSAFSKHMTEISSYTGSRPQGR